MTTPRTGRGVHLLLGELNQFPGYSFAVMWWHHIPFGDGGRRAGVVLAFPNAALRALFACPGGGSYACHWSLQFHVLVSNKGLGP